MNTSSAYNGTLNMVSSTYFSDNNLDIATLQLVDGVVVFDDGIVGKITAVASDSISYTSTTDYRLWDEAI